ncbi:MAG: DUF1833 family protein [Hydrogenophaga sp.]|uniref:DUF1833 family protein n=1 Tax=Hydrogenophaga sp. TaxID=1904254 RepID=UPI003D9B92E6
MVTATARAQLQRVSDPSGMLLLLRLTHPSIETAYVVNDTRDWTISGITWVGLPFRFTLPNDDAQAPQARIELDNVGRELTQVLEALPPGGALQATFRLVSRAAPTVVEYEFSAPLSGVQVTTATVQAVVGTDDELRMPAVGVRYDQTTTPGLFEG